MKDKTKKMRWFELFAPSAQNFHGLGKGLGRGRGPRLAEVPKGADKTDDEVRREVLISA